MRSEFAVESEKAMAWGRSRAGFQRALAAAVCAGFLTAGPLAAAPPAAAPPSAAAPPAAAPLAASPPAASPQPTRRLIQQLGDPDYFVRQRAEAELAGLGFEAFEALTEAASNDDLEIALRARRLLKLIKVQWADPNDPPAVQRLLHDYQSQDSRTRQTQMSQLALLPNGAGMPALCRLVRYERSPLLAKQAALKLLGLVKAGAPPGKELAAQIRKGLADSPRTPARWPLIWLRFDEDARAALEQWTAAVEAEEGLLRTAPGQTNPEIVAALLRLEVARLKQLDRAPQAARAVARLIELDKGDPDTLAELLEWLITQKDWQGVDRLAERFAAAVEATPALLYLLAEARADQGRAEKAEQIARQALALNPGGGLPQASLHLMVAVNLQQRGRFAWAEREYRQAAGAAPPTSDLAVTAMCYLAEMFHDQAQERQAGEVLQQVVEALGANRPNEAQAARRTLGEIRARMNFFFACHWQAQGDEAQRRAYLDKGLAADPTDVDVLIGCYRLGPAPPEFRRKIQKLIADAVKDMREKIADDLDSPSNYNQVAWLVANTEGNLDQALADSNKSIELSPRTGGYYDTLGRVYFARGDYENAVKNQTRAAELEPHSGQIIRQLELFRKTRAEKQKTDLPSPSGRGAGGEGTGKSQKQGGTFSRPTALTISRRERGPGIRSLQVAMEQARRSPATIITN
ncbi:MAG: hypothetical protein ABSF26_20830 [Thermoguttaceae bacterium]|jgi:tetratricopeptide (TPR) repeat protein